MESVKNKNILIAGASGGIGAATARLLSGSGATVFLAGRNAEKLQALATTSNIPAERIFVAELSDANEVNAMAAKVHAIIPQLDILINASGIGIIKPIEALSSEDFIKTINTNLVGSFFLVKAFLPKMKETKKGLIINIPGVLGKVPMAGAAAYSASKYGLVGMMQSIREELKRTEIRITNLYLGGVDSPFWDAIDLRVQREKMIQAEEAAKAIWFLCQQPVSGVVSEMVLQPFNHQAI
ncbi:MAG: SDR family oxidoreductase [Chitinophagaceae bacterium]|nr:SDR family oxidoreductase [Chitinophagaceae bacterium]